MSRLRDRLGIEDSDTSRQDTTEDVKDIPKKAETIRLNYNEAGILRNTGSIQKDEDDIDDILGNSTASEKSGPKQTEKAKKNPREKSSAEKELSERLRQKRGRTQDSREKSGEEKQESNEKTSIYGKELEPLSDIDNDLEEIQKLRIQGKRRNVISRFAMLIMAAGCVYAIFLIFGVFMTDYQYDVTGEVKAQVLTVDDIKARNNYNVLKVQYEKLRVVYEDILQLDAQLGEAVDGYAVLGGEYAGLMDETEDLGIKTDALTVESKYQPTKDLMYSWIREYAWNYLVAISSALTNNDAEAADSAIVYKNYMYSVFANVTDNVISLGEGLKGIDLDNIRSWDPDVYKQDYLNGKL